MYSTIDVNLFLPARASEQGNVESDWCPSEVVVHARNVIAFFVWAWPSGFCD